MSRKLTRKASSGFMALLLGIVAGVAQAAGPLPVNSNAYGKGYDELAANWLEWAISIPASTNPILDTTGAYAAMGQSGKVWFLAGTTGGAPAVTRTITVPSGAALFFPIVNYFWLNTPEGNPPDPPWSPEWEAFVRAYLASLVDTYQGLSLTIDGKAVPNVETLRVASTLGSCTPPADDNIFGIPYGYRGLTPKHGHRPVELTPDAVTPPVASILTLPAAPLPTTSSPVNSSKPPLKLRIWPPFVSCSPPTFTETAPALPSPT